MPGKAKEIGRLAGVQTTQEGKERQITLLMLKNKKINPYTVLFVCELTP